MDLSDIDLSYLNNIQPSEYANFRVSILINKLLERLPDEKVSEENMPESYDQIVELFKVIEEIVKMYKGEISVEFLNKVRELKTIANLREYNSDLYITLGFALSDAEDLTVGEFNLELLEEYTREELASHYRNLSRPYERAMRTAINQNAAQTQMDFNPNPKLMKIIDDRMKVIDGTDALDKRIRFLVDLIQAGNSKRVITEGYPLRNLMRILGEDLSAEDRQRIVDLVASLEGNEAYAALKIDLENALQGNFETPLPEGFYDKKEDEA